MALGDAAGNGTTIGYDLLGHASALNGDPDRAISTLRKAIELDPEYASAYAHLGRAYYTLLNWESAIENFNKAFAMGLKNEEYFYEQAVTVVEWAERLKRFLPKEYLKVEFFIKGPTKRGLKLSAFGQRYRELLGLVRQKSPGGVKGPLILT